MKRQIKFKKKSLKRLMPKRVMTFDPNGESFQRSDRISRWYMIQETVKKSELPGVPPGFPTN